jgi:hypothetical protein
MLGTVFYLGFPQKQILHMTIAEKLIWLCVVCGCYTLLILVSCYFYTLILKKRGQIGCNTVGVDVEGSIFFTDASGSFDANSETDARLAMVKQWKQEIESAIISLKTNFVLSVTLSLFLLLGVLLSTENLAILFIFLTGQIPVWSTVFNFHKIQNLVSISIETFIIRLKECEEQFM